MLTELVVYLTKSYIIVSSPLFIDDDMTGIDKNVTAVKILFPLTLYGQLNKINLAMPHALAVSCNGIKFRIICLVAL